MSLLALRPLQLAKAMAERQRDVVATALALAVQNQQAAQAQMQQLEAYARETEVKWMQRAQVAASPEIMQHHYQFIAKLEEAIAFQVRVIDNHSGRVMQVRLGLIEVEQRLARFKHILTLRQAEITLVHNRQEQRQMDELASRMGHQRRRPLDAEESKWQSN